MPITLGAIRKQRADKRKDVVNAQIRTAFRKAVLAVRKSPKPAALKKAFSALDRAAKSKVIHKNKASRLKSRLSKLLLKKK
ncbi:MAG: 30S ribosomal protein S20 [Candidatus Amesbacteria bacterium GW2011_GWA2_42_12]|uniref:Small ribosomal subunit protein bS20 n=1 Tax=Candidatus Amesbacteria bacterium GW2011_GWA2_42_12 TaxID=1618356 RepID=A0A0G0Y975_9BACT|nr:MAG: 30S ribosomal protein S20 [Candidatus Amesbacteria bacterium GW2011_GWA2_42_12]